jgi:hypothetical protein
MNLTAARLKFRELRQDHHRIRVRSHAWREHPERCFSPDEIIELICHSSGELADNRAATATPDSFVLRCCDRRNRRCEMVVVFEVSSTTGDWLIVISAFRKV